jgi:hypothetical protein
MDKGEEQGTVKFVEEVVLDDRFNWRGDIDTAPTSVICVWIILNDMLLSTFCITPSLATHSTVLYSALLTAAM